MNKKAEAGKRILMVFLLVAMLMFTVKYSQSATVICDYDPMSAVCDNAGTKIMGIYNITNAHVELWNGTLYNPGVCCKDIGVANLSLNNTFGYNFLDASSATNAHVEEPGQSGGYPYDMYLGFDGGNTVCAVVNTSTNCTDAGYDTCVVRLSNRSNAHVESCNQTSYPYQVCCDLRYTEGQGWSNITLPEGIHTIQPASLPGYGTYRYRVNITFVNFTASHGDVVGCFVRQSNCYDAQLPGCTEIYINKTVGGGAWQENYTIGYDLQPTDSVNTTQGGQTTQWIPWEVINCSASNDWNGTYFSENTTWRIHVHGIDWETGDIARANNCYNGLSNEYFKNTIKCDALGDVSFASAMYSGTKVEGLCHDGIDNEDPDSSIDCSDTECWGITYSCLAKEDIANSSLSYSPSGSHGTLANDIKPGDIDSVTSDANTLNTRVEWTQHANPSGTFKMRFYRWNINRVATITVEGLPEINEVNKYAAGNDESTGLMEYFKVNVGGEPTVDTDYLGQTGNITYPNKFVIKSFSASQQITNLDTTVNVTFLNPSSINLTEGYNVTITLAYCQGASCYNDYITIPIYFDNVSFTSMNENESDIWVSGVSWGVCNDTKNADFDYLGSSPQYSFDQQSYDCYDVDCNNLPGTSAWNAYLGMNTVGDCEYSGEQTCYDQYNNDWALEDATWGHSNTNGATMLPDCRDDECHMQQGNETYSGHLCNYNRELNCSDGFDNDQYQSYDCAADTAQSLGSYEYWEYDCQSYCRDGVVVSVETGDLCFDSVDNDMDKFVFTTDNSSYGQTALNNSYGAGVDCQYYAAGSLAADEDCNLSINSSNGFRCELGVELSCTDGFDNDMDNTNATGWSGAYDGYFTHDVGADCSDYDCANRIDSNGNFFNAEEGEFYACPLKEYSPDGSDGFYQGNASWCFDGIDNDLDGVFDCQDINCIYAVHPDYPEIVCYPQEFNLSLEFQVCDNYFSALPFDDDGDSNANCEDSDCKQKFGYCGPCPTYENITWDSCADGEDNDNDGDIDCDDADCDNELGDYDGHFCEYSAESTCDDGFDNDGDGSVDCADSDCNGVGICEATESSCNDDQDNDGDGAIDCEDSNCAGTCDLTSTMGGAFFPTTSQSTWGSATVTWDLRVREGDNYSVNVDYGSTYKSATVTIGNLAAGKEGLPLNSGLNAPGFSVTGPSASDFETQSYSEDAPPTKGQVVITDGDHSGTAYPAFDVTIEIPTNDTMAYDDFEYIHSILKGDDSIDNVQNQFLDAYVLDDVDPSIDDIDTEPGNKDLEYGESFWISVKATDPANAKLPGAYNGRIYRCYFNISGPGYTQSYTADSDCVRTYTNIIDDGNYEVNVYPQDSTGNYGTVETRNYNIDLVPKYVDYSFNLSKVFYNASLNITNVTAKFYTDDASSISTCSVYAVNSVGVTSLLGTISASNSGDLLTCDGNVTLPVADEMYELYVEVTDDESDKANSTVEVFYVCNNLNSSGDGWKCSKADFDQDGWTEGIVENTYGVDRACDMCLGITNLGLDIDADGVDDACDTPYLVATIPNQAWPENTNHTLNLSQYFDDRDEDDLNYSFTEITNVQVTVDNDTGIVSFVPDMYFNGIRFITFYAFDEEGKNGTSNNVMLTIGSVNNNPYLAQNITNITWAEDTNATINLSEYFSDYDYDDLNYTATSVENISIFVNNVTDIVTLVPGLNFYGIRNVVFYAFDNSSNASSDNVTLNVTAVNDVPFAVGLISPIDEYNTTNTTPSFNWTNTTDVEGDSIWYYLQLSDDNYSTIVEYYSNVTEYSLDVSLGDGVWLWRVKACDDGSAADNCSYSVNRTLRVDAAAPNIVIDSPVNGQVVGWNVSLETTITDTFEVDSAWYEIVNGSLVDSGVLLENNSYDWYWFTNNSFSDGNYTFVVYANDTLGQMNSVNSTFVLDNSKPRITFNIPSASYHGIDFNMDVLLQSGLLASVDYNITNSSGLVQNNSIVLNSSSYTLADLVNLSLYAEGNYTLTVYVVDNVGNNNTDSTWFVVDKTYPRYFNFSYGPATVYNDGEFEVNITWTDNNNVSAVYIEHDANGSLVNYSAVDLGSGQYRAVINSSLLDNNEDIDWKMYGVDVANNVNKTGQQSFTVANRDPNSSVIPTITWDEDTSYLLNLSVYFTDADGDDLNFTGTALIDINITIDNDTAIVNLTPAVDWYGSESIVFTAYDQFGGSVDSNSVTLTVSNTAECGDNICELAETYENCPADCDAPPSPPSPPPLTPCVEEWTCTPWTPCRPIETRLRTCHEKGVCDDFYNENIMDKVYESKKPVEIENCTYVPTCDDNVQNGEEIDVDCGGECGGCGLGQGCKVDVDCLSRYCKEAYCVQPTCDDNVQNQNESGIDCGWPCDPCPTCEDGIQNGNETGIDCGGECEVCGPRVEEPTLIDTIRGREVEKTNLTIYINESSLVKFRGEFYNLDLFEINPNNVWIMVRQTGQLMNVKIGYVEYADLDLDGINDIAVRLDSLTERKAVLNITLYKPSYIIEVLLLTGLISYLVWFIGRKLMLFDIIEYMIKGQKKIKKEVRKVRGMLTKRRRVRPEDLKKLRDINKKLVKIKKDLKSERVKSKEQFKKDLEELENLKREKKLEKELIKAKEDLHHVKHPRKVRKITSLAGAVVYVKSIWDKIFKKAEVREKEITEDIKKIEKEIKGEEKVVEKVKIEEVYPVEKIIKHRKTKFEKLDEQISGIDSELEKLRHAVVESPEVHLRRKPVVVREVPHFVVKRKGLKKLDKQLDRIDSELESLRNPPKSIVIHKKIAKKVVEKVKEVVKVRERTADEKKLDSEISKIDEQLKKIKEAPSVEEKFKRRPVRDFYRARAKEEVREKSVAEKKLEKKIASIDDEIKELSKPVVEEEVRPKKKIVEKVKEAVKQLVKPAKKRPGLKKLDKEISKIDKQLEGMRGVSEEVEVRPKLRKKKVVEEVKEEEPKVREKSRAEKRLEKEISDLDKQLAGMRGVPAEVEVKPRKKIVEKVKEVVKQIVKPAKKRPGLKKLDKEISKIDKQLEGMRGVPEEVEVKPKLRKKKVVEEVKVKKKPVVVEKPAEVPKIREKSRAEKRLEKEINDLDEQLERMKGVAPEEEIKPEREKKTIKQIIKQLVKPAKKRPGLKKLDKEISKIDKQLEGMRGVPAEVEVKPKKRPIKEIVKEIIKPKVRKTKQEERLGKRISKIDELIKRVREAPDVVEKPKRKKKVIEKAVEVPKVREKTKAEIKLEKSISEIDKQLEGMMGVPAEAEIKPKKEKKTVKEIIKKLIKPKIRKTKAEQRLDKNLERIGEQLKDVGRVFEPSEEEQLDELGRKVRRKELGLLERLRDAKARELKELLGEEKESKKEKIESKFSRKISDIDDELRKIRKAPEVVEEVRVRRKPVREFVKKIVKKTAKGPSKKEMKIDKQISQIDEELRRMKYPEEKEDAGIYEVLRRKKVKGKR